MDVLRQIIEMDKAARERTANVRAEQERRSEQAGAETARRRSALIESEQKKLGEYKAAREAELAQRLSGAESVRAEQYARLDGIFAENAARWRADIIRRITG